MISQENYITETCAKFSTLLRGVKKEHVGDSVRFSRPAALSI